MKPINDHSRRGFELNYDAQITPSDKPYRRVRRKSTMEIVQSLYTQPFYFEDCVEQVPMIEIVMPRDKLPDLLESQDAYLFAREQEERRIRMENPILEQLWDQYQTMLALLRQ